MPAKGENAVCLSLVVPAYNEEAVLELFVERAAAAASRITDSYEVIFVDDGSSDGTAALVKRLHREDGRLKLVQLSRNFGKDAAVSAGLDSCSGQLVAVMDADLQDPPELLEEMHARLEEGYDAVYAVRRGREGESRFKRLTSWLYYRLLTRLSGRDFPLDTGDFRLMNRRVVEAVRRLGESNRYMKGIFHWVGFRQAPVYYHRPSREAGDTKYGLALMLRHALDGITAFSYLPLRFAGLLGGLAAVFAFAYAIFLFLRTLLLGVDVPGYASLMVTILFFSGAQLICLGVLGEYLGRMFIESKGRPLYLVRERLGEFPG